jgi:hypothetical protein
MISSVSPGLILLNSDIAVHRGDAIGWAAGADAYTVPLLNPVAVLAVVGNVLDRGWQ